MRRSVLSFLPSLALLLFGQAGPALAGMCEDAAQGKGPAGFLDPSPAEIPGSIVHIYKTVAGRGLRVYVRYPEGGIDKAKPKAALVFFFGGGWMGGNVLISQPTAQRISARGAVTIQVDYRVYCRDKVDITQEMDDARDAILWVRTHAGELGIDPHRIAAYGGSAGGHLALSTAVFSTTGKDGAGNTISSAPDLLLLYYPCVDETSPIERDGSEEVLGAHGADVSPAKYIKPGLPPTVIFQGDKDTLYPLTKDYCAKAVQAGDSCKFIELPGVFHGFFAQPGPAYDFGLAGMDLYLTNAGYLPRKARS